MDGITVTSGGREAAAGVGPAPSRPRTCPAFFCAVAAATRPTESHHDYNKDKAIANSGLPLRTSLTGYSKTTSQLYILYIQ